MRIGTLARLVGVSTRALRYYEEQGLIRAERTAGGQRAYTDATVERVRLIRTLLSAGLTSRTITRILPCLDTGGIDRSQLTLLNQEQQRMTAQIADLTRARMRLQEVISSAVVVGSAP